MTTPEQDDSIVPETGDVGGITEPDELDAPDEGLLSRLTVIEDQPLEDRAAAYTQLYDGLRQQLEA